LKKAQSGLHLPLQAAPKTREKTKNGQNDGEIVFAVIFSVPFLFAVRILVGETFRGGTFWSDTSRLEARRSGGKTATGEKS